MERRTYSRQELYKLVWQQPLRTVAKTIGISDVRLAKVCRKLQIPLPERGHWARAAAGEASPPKPLESGQGILPVVTFHSMQPRIAKKATPLPVDLPKISNAISALPISNLKAPHHLVREYRADLRKREVGSRGLRESELIAGLRFHVSPNTEQRALALMDTLIKSLKKVGVTLEVSERAVRHWHENKRFLTISGDELKLNIRESYNQRPKSDKEIRAEKEAGAYWIGKVNFVPNGRLNLEIVNGPRGYVASWSDGSTSIESKLVEIVQTLCAFPVLVQQEREKAIAAGERERVEYERRMELRQAQEKRASYRLQLLEEATNYRNCLLLNEYLNHIDDVASRSGTAVGREFPSRMAEARALAEELDPTNHRIAIWTEVRQKTNS